MCNVAHLSFTSEKQKVADEKNIVRINKEIERVDMLLQSITNEHIQVSAINNQVRNKLFSEQDKASRAEESLKVSFTTSIFIVTQ